MRIKPLRPGSAEFKRQCNAYENFVGAAHDKPARDLRAVKPKREIRRPVDNKPVVPSEHQEQVIVVTWWGLQHEIYGLPIFALAACPNGGARDMITGAKLKAEGVRAGWPDLCLAAPRGQYHGLYIEMTAIDGREADTQRAVGEYLTSAMYKFRFCYGADEAIALIKEYLA